MTIVIFGATGDLAVKKLFPALSSLMSDDLLPKGARIIAVSRRDWGTSEFRAFLRESGSDISDRLIEHIEYADVDFDVRRGYDRLKKVLDETANSQLLIYLSLAPRWFTPVIEDLRDADILKRGQVKLLLEKPFGTDTASAEALNSALLSFLDPAQIYRVDHYLGKETVQAIMDEHERSPKLRQILSNQTIERIAVELSEAKGIEGRASYDSVGAFRDVGQNHLLEVLAVLVAEYPRQEASAGAWQDARAKVLESLALPSATDSAARRGQYMEYPAERGVTEGSDTETAFELRTYFEEGELSDVPVTLRAGKLLPQNYAGISIFFRPTGNLPAEMRFEIQPVARMVMRQRDGSLASIPLPPGRDAYHNVIEDAIKGEARRFVGTKEVLAAWRYADAVLPILLAAPLEAYSIDRPFYR